MARTLETDPDRVYERIVTEVAAIDGTDPTELPPLFNAVDPDALLSVFSATESGVSRTGRVEFPYAGYEITIVFDGDPTLRIERA